MGFRCSRSAACAPPSRDCRARRRPQAGEPLPAGLAGRPQPARHQHARQQAHRAFAGRGRERAPGIAQGLVAARRGDQQARAHRLAVQAGRGGEQPATAMHHAALQPDRPAVALDAGAHRQLAAPEALAGGRAAEAQHLAADEAGIAFQAHLGGEPGERAFMDDALLRQPLAHRARRHRDVLREHAARAGAAVPLAGARGGQQHVRARADAQVHPQLVAADDAGGRVHQQGVADGLAFRVERALHAQRAEVLTACEHAACAALLVFQAQPGAPGRGYRGAGGGQ